jgi:hypothetical protein
MYRYGRYGGRSSAEIVRTRNMHALPQRSVVSRIKVPRFSVAVIIFTRRFL